MQRMIMEGVKDYGVTTMYMEKGLDTGPMLEKWSTPLRDEDNFETVHDTLAREGAELLLSTLRKAQAGELHPQKQDDSKATYASKIEKSDCLREKRTAGTQSDSGPFAGAAFLHGSEGKNAENPFLPHRRGKGKAGVARSGAFL